MTKKEEDNKKEKKDPKEIFKKMIKAQEDFKRKKEEK